jgi:hypothetical protein
MHELLITFIRATHACYFCLAFGGYNIIPRIWKSITILAGDEIEKNEMGGACSVYGGGERCVQGFGGET